MPGPSVISHAVWTYHQSLLYLAKLLIMVIKMIIVMLAIGVIITLIMIMELTKRT